EVRARRRNPRRACLRLLPAQQVAGVGELPQPGHPVRTRAVPGSVGDDRSVVRPPSARSVVPGPGRLGLVEPTAADELKQLGWNDTESIELLWALSRAPNADLALRSLVRLSEAMGEDWAELDS